MLDVKTVVLPFAIAFASFCMSCASAPPATHVRYADLGTGALQDYDGKTPLVVEFSEGDRIPVNFQFTADHFALEPASPNLVLVAKTHCFVRFGTDGIKVSTDGRSFDEKPRQPGRFGIGLKSERGQPTRLEVVIVAPRR